MANFLNSELLPALLGAILGLILSIIFDDYLRSMKRNIKRNFKRLFTVKNEPTSHLFSFGDVDTNFYVIEGDGVIEFETGNIECRMASKEVVLPADLQQLKNEIEEVENRKKQEGIDYKWNGDLYGLTNYRMARQAEREEPTALFQFHLTDYYTFLATNIQLDSPLPTGETIREKYLPYHHLDKVEPYLANGFGVVLVVLTSDENLILTKRTNISGARANEMDVSVVEGVHPSFDKDNRSDGPDLFRAAARGANEELGLDVKETDIRFLGYGVDTDYYQWNMIGYVHIDETAEEVKALRSRGASGKWENTQLIFENFKAKNVAKLIVQEAMWSTAKVALYWTAVNQLGKRDIDHCIKKIQRKPKSSNK